MSTGTDRHESILDCFRLARRNHRDEDMVPKLESMAAEQLVRLVESTDADPLGSIVSEVILGLENDLADEGWKPGTVREFLESVQHTATGRLLRAHRSL